MFRSHSAAGSARGCTQGGSGWCKTSLCHGSKFDRSPGSQQVRSPLRILGAGKGLLLYQTSWLKLVNHSDLLQSDTADLPHPTNPQRQDNNLKMPTTLQLQNCAKNSGQEPQEHQVDQVLQLRAFGSRPSTFLHGRIANDQRVPCLDDWQSRRAGGLRVFGSLVDICFRFSKKKLKQYNNAERPKGQRKAGNPTFSYYNQPNTWFQFSRRATGGGFWCLQHLHPWNPPQLELGAWQLGSDWA